MILTRQKNVPWLWVWLLTSTGFVATFLEVTNGAALAFTLRKFTADPALIVFLGSLNVAFNFLVAPYVSWKSDNIWTALGRRKPFIIAGLCLLVPALIATPLAPSLWLLILAIVVWQFAMDVGYTAPWAPLLYEIVPTHQRGRMVAIKRLFSVLARLAFNWVFIGQFDRVYHLNLGVGTFRITGEEVIYFTAAALVAMAMLHILFNVREILPGDQPPRERFHLKSYVIEVFGDRQFQLLYLLLFCNISVAVTLAQLEPLLVTEQFGFSKSLLGQIKGITLLFDLVMVLPVMAYISDRFDRFRIFQIGLFVSAGSTLLFWLFVKFIAPHQIPTPTEYTIYYLSHTFVDACALLALEPYFFDLVPRNKMGAMNSGFLFVRGLLSVIVVNGLGLWVKFFSRLFMPEGKNDYLSGYIYMFLVGLLGCLGTIYFDRQRQQGKLIAYGLMEEEQSSK